jgi:hypothetical protein
MSEFEVWVDVECTDGGSSEVVCSLFARQTLPLRPVAGERLSFHSARDSSSHFNLSMAWGPMPASHVSMEIEDVSHDRSPGTPFTTSLRCSRLQVPSVEDARKAVAFLCEQHGFEVDPYGVNRLEQ